MDLNSALDIIIRDLREARTIIDDLKNVKGVSIIQVELAKSKCKNAEEIIELLKTIEQPGINAVSATPDQGPELSDRSVSDRSATEVSAPAEIPAAEVSAPAERPDADYKGKEALTSGDTTEKTKAESLIELEAEPEEAVLQDEAVADTDKKAETKKSPDAEQKNAEQKDVEKKSVKGVPILADRYGEPADRVNERLRGTRGDNDISSKLSQAPIGNLADAIGINDRFFYIREVFGGNKEAYNSAIDKLNSATSSDEAEQVLNDYFSGEGDPAAVRSLLDLVRRKTGFNG